MVPLRSKPQKKVKLRIRTPKRAPLTKYTFVSPFTIENAPTSIKSRNLDFTDELETRGRSEDPLEQSNFQRYNIVEEHAINGSRISLSMDISDDENDMAPRARPASRLRWCDDENRGKIWTDHRVIDEEAEIGGRLAGLYRVSARRGSPRAGGIDSRQGTTAVVSPTHSPSCESGNNLASPVTPISNVPLERRCSIWAGEAFSPENMPLPSSDSFSNESKNGLAVTLPSTYDWAAATAYLRGLAHKELEVQAKENRALVRASFLETISEEDEEKE